MAKAIKPFDGLAYNYDLAPMVPQIGNGGTYASSYDQGLYGDPRVPNPPPGQAPTLQALLGLLGGPGPSGLPGFPSPQGTDQTNANQGNSDIRNPLAGLAPAGMGDNLSGELTPEERYQMAIAAIRKPQFQKYTGYDTIPIPDPGKAPVYDRGSEREAAIQAARIAAIAQAIGAISGGGAGSTSLAARLGTNFFGGAQQGLASDFKGAQANYANNSDNLEKRYASQLRGLQGQNQAVDQANDNERSVYQSELANAGRQYGVDIANDKANKDRDFKVKESERKTDEAKIRAGVALASKGLLNDAGEEDVARLLSKYTGTGFSPDFLLSMTEEQKGKLNELALSREQRASLQTERLKSQELIKDADRKEMTRRAASRNSLLNTLNQRTNETRAKIAALKASKSPTAANTNAQLRGQLQFLTGLSTRVSRANTEAQRFEKMAQDLLKDAARQDKNGAHGLNKVGEEEYSRLRAQADQAHGMAEKLDAYYRQISESTTSGLGLPQMPGDNLDPGVQDFINGGGFFGGGGGTAPVTVDEEVNRRLQAFARERGSAPSPVPKKTPLKKGATSGGFTIEEIRN